MADETTVAAGRVPAGTRLNDTYEVDALIAAGGMGEVYRGHLIETGDQVAIKLIRPELVGNEAALALFRKEASALHHLHHEAIIRYFVFAIDPTLRRPYLAMEFVDGEPLSDLIRRTPLGAEQCLALVRRLAAGLAAAHEIGIVHRDISADNVILPGGDVRRAKIIDFGIAKSTLSGATTVIGDGFAGKYNYASPEQLGLFGGVVTAKSDIYSLGLLMAEALRGRPLDMGHSHVETVERRRVVPPLDGVDPKLAPLIAAMLQPAPDDRPASMDAVRDWQPAAAPEESGARRRGRLREVEAALAVPPRRRWRTMAVAAAVLALITTAGFSVITWAPGLIPGVGRDAVEDGPFEPVPPNFRTPGAGRDDRLPELVPRDTVREAPEPDSEPGARPPTAEPARVGPGQTAPDRPAPERARDDRPVPDRPDQDPPASGRPVPDQPHLDPAATDPRPADPVPAIISPPVTPPVIPSVTTPPVVTPQVSAPRTPAEFVRAFDGGPCLFLAVRSESPGRVAVEAFGNMPAAVNRFDTAFRQAFGFEAAIQLRLLTDAQCPAAAFLKAVAAERAPALRFELASFSVPAGGQLEGMILGADSRNVAVLVVAADGAVRLGNVRSQADGARRVSITTEPGRQGARQGELALAIATAQRPAALDFRGRVPAASLFPALQGELAAAAQPVAVLRQYFRVE